MLTTPVELLGKYIISTTYAVLYKHSAELFATVFGSSDVAFGTMCKCISAVVVLITLLDYFHPTISTLVFWHITSI